MICFCQYCNTDVMMMINSQSFRMNLIVNVKIIQNPMCRGFSFLQELLSLILYLSNCNVICAHTIVYCLKMENANFKELNFKKIKNNNLVRIRKS